MIKKSGKKTDAIKTVEECNQELKILGLSEGQVKELNDAVNTIIDMVLDDYINQNYGIQKSDNIYQSKL